MSIELGHFPTVLGLFGAVTSGFDGEFRPNHGELSQFAGIRRSYVEIGRQFRPCQRRAAAIPRGSTQPRPVVVIGPGLDATWSVVIATGLDATWSVVIATGLDATWSVVIATGLDATWSVVIATGLDATSSSRRNCDGARPLRQGPFARALDQKEIGERRLRK